MPMRALLRITIMLLTVMNAHGMGSWGLGKSAPTPVDMQGAGIMRVAGTALVVGAIGGAFVALLEAKKKNEDDAGSEFTQKIMRAGLKGATCAVAGVLLWESFFSTSVSWFAHMTIRKTVGIALLGVRLLLPLINSISSEDE